MARRKSNIVT